MISDRQNFKVFKSVIVLNFIPMVDMLPSLQASAHMRRHDDAMLKLKFTVDFNNATYPSSGQIGQCTGDVPGIPSSNT